MKAALTALSLCMSLSRVNAATPEDAYIAARDAAIAKIKALEAKKADAAADKAHKAATADLEERLRAIIGDIDIAGFPKKGVINLDSLTDSEVGFGMLDALRFTKGDEGPQAIVTTDSLLEKWLRGAEWWKKARKTAPDIRVVFADDAFYSEAIGADAAFSKLAELHIRKPDGATFAIALLGGCAQDVGPNPAQEIVVAVQLSGKTFIVSRNVEKATTIPACETIWKETELKAMAAKDSSAVYDKGDRDYHVCVAERAPKQSFFPGLVKSAQEIADRFTRE